VRRRWGRPRRDGRGGPSSGIGPADGTKTVRYVAYTDDRTFLLDYNQAPGDPEVLSDFEAIVTTFSFIPS
jgi:hypothetical protein